MINLTDNALLHLRSLIKEHNKKLFVYKLKVVVLIMNMNGRFQMKKLEMM